MSVKVTRTSPMTGTENTVELFITQYEWEMGCYLRDDGALIQHAFPMLDATEREFIMSGISPEEQDSIFG